MRRWHGARGLRLAVLGAGMLAGLSGCGPEKTDNPPADPNGMTRGRGTVDIRLNPDEWQRLPSVDSVLGTSENTARAAAGLRRAGVPSSMAGDLHLALYRAAFEWSHDRGWWSPLMCLRSTESAPASVTPRDYYIDVLGSMVDQSPALAWVTPMSGRRATYPGTDERVPLLSINVLGLDASRGMARAEVSVIGVDGPEIGRTATAQHDGTKWILTFQPVTWTR